MANKTRVTIKDVAKAANVTPQTVSRALRDARDISDETRERILNIAAQLNYVKNSTASALRRGSTRIIAVIYDNLRNVYFSIMADYIQYCLKERGYSMLTVSIRKSHLDEQTYMTAISHNVDGIISFIEPKSEISSLINKYNVPVLLFGRRTEVPDIYCVHTDDEKGGELAAKRLMADGCEKFLCLFEVLSLTCAYDRYSGFVKTLKNNGLKEPDLFIVSGLPEEEIEKKLVRLASEGNYPDGIFCFNDMLAFETLFYIEKNNLPDVKIIGFDNIQEEIKIPHRLTSVGTDKLSLCQQAVDIIIDRTENDEPLFYNGKADVFLADGVTA